MLSKLNNAQTSEFVEEAIPCMEAGAHRASTVMVWVGAMSVLHSHVHATHLAVFNAEANRRFKNWTPAATPDDFSSMKESHFLEILETLHIIGREEKKHLCECLGWRNSSGHPNEITIGEQKVAAHIETLVNIVFAKFG